MSNPQHVIHLISDYIEESITPAGAEKVKAHLTFCWSCRQALAESKEHMQALKKTPAVAVPAGLEARVLARVRAEADRPMVVPEPSKFAWPSWFTPVRGFAFAAACGLAVLVVREIPRGPDAPSLQRTETSRDAVAPKVAEESQLAQPAPAEKPQRYDAVGGVAAGAAADQDAGAMNDNLMKKRAEPPAFEQEAAVEGRLKSEAKADAAVPPAAPALSSRAAGERAVPLTPADEALLAEQREARRQRRREAMAAKMAAAQTSAAGAATGEADGGLSGSRSSIQTRTELVINSAEEWASTWKLHHAANDVTPPLPAVDFEKQQVLAIFAGEQPSPGYRLELIEVAQTTWNGGPARVVRYRVRAPQPGAVAAQVITYPYLFSIQPRFDGSTFFDKRP